MSKRSKLGLPPALSVGEETFALGCRIHNLHPEREYLFARPRMFRFDFAFPDRKLAVEIEGGTFFGKSRHGSGPGFERDCEKYNIAAKLGWRVLRYTTAMVERGEAINEVMEIL